MTEALQEIREGFSAKQIKMAIGVASDKRYAGGNMTGAVDAIEKIKKGLSDHPQVAAVLKRQNEDLEEELDEGKMKDRLTKAQDLMGPSKNREQGIEFVMKGLKVSKKEATKLVDAVLDMVMNNEVEIDEMKMNDPKLNKIFDKLKKGDTVKLKTSSTINQGKDFVEYIVKSKNTVNKGRVEKITLVTKGNEKAVKKFLYKRDGQVTFAIGDMGASIDDIKEENLDEAVKYQFVAIDRLGKVIGFASDERDAKDMATRGHTMDSPSKGKGVAGRNKAKVVKLKKPMSDKQGDMMINRDFDMNKFGGETTYSIGLKEEVELGEGYEKEVLLVLKDAGISGSFRSGRLYVDKQDVKDAKSALKDSDKFNSLPRIVGEEDEKKMDKPDSAKEVDQMRDDKKKTRIAQLQLQIAKATETINKLNTQEKPNA
jgi:hypothetical protein